MYNTAAHCGLYQQKPSSRICQHREEWACLQDRTKKCALCKCPIVLDTCVMQLCCIILTQRLCICSRMLFLHCYELMQPAANEVDATDMCRTERLELMWAFACELRQYITVTVCFFVFFMLFGPTLPVVERIPYIYRVTQVLMIVIRASQLNSTWIRL